MVNLGDEFPNFTADTTAGKVEFYNWIGDSWCIFFSHPNAFTPVCTTELGRVAQLMPEFSKRNCKVIGCSCDGVNDNKKWTEDIKSYSKIEGDGFPYPIIADESRSLAVQLGMIDPAEKNKDGLPVTCRAVFIVDPKKILRLSILYPATTGRDFNEILRVLDSLQLTDIKQVATPVDWKLGDSCMVLPTLSTDEAHGLFPAGFKTVQVPSGLDYIRITPQP
uniref:1-Cys peroxiredoxin n=1 Tax=Riptortus pedestris TaxID=329032 RepID=R4WDY2_RIPPE|nr:peroxiredoxin [Riptortus pedestris]